MQLVDVLQSTPEVYELVVTIRGYEVKDRLLEIGKSLDRSQFKNTSESKCGIFTNLQSILECHTLGYDFHRFLLLMRGGSHLDEDSLQVVSKYLPSYSNEGIKKWSDTFHYLLESLLYEF